MDRQSSRVGWGGGGYQIKVETDIKPFGVRRMASVAIPSRVAKLQRLREGESGARTIGRRSLTSSASGELICRCKVTVQQQKV